MILLSLWNHYLDSWLYTFYWLLSNRQKYSFIFLTHHSIEVDKMKNVSIKNTSSLKISTLSVELQLTKETNCFI